MIGYEDMVNEIKDVMYDECTAWEVEFIDSIAQQLSEDRELSTKQEDVIENIYNKLCK